MVCRNVVRMVDLPFASWTIKIALVLWLAWPSMSFSAPSEVQRQEKTYCLHWLRNSTRRLAIGDRSMIGSEAEAACLRILLEVSGEAHGASGELLESGKEGEVGHETGDVGEESKASHERPTVEEQRKELVNGEAHSASGEPLESGKEAEVGHETGDVGEESEASHEHLTVEEQIKELEEEAKERIEQEEEMGEWNGTDRQVACMLLGSVSFVLALLYLVNWDDDDIRRYTWKVISTTISIFLAVLLFGGFNQLVLDRFGTKEEIEELPPPKKVILSIVQVLHCLVYVVALQLAIGIISGAMFEKDDIDIDELHWVINSPLTKDHDSKVSQDKLKQIRTPTAMSSNMIDEFGLPVPVRRVPVEYERRDRRMKCYARLLAHMAGFAAINAGATMQQLKVFHHWAKLFIPIVIVQSIIMIVFKIFKGLRHLVKEKAKKEKTKCSKMRRAAMMSEEVCEAENEISCLSISFLVIQVIRFALTGILPDPEGLEPGNPAHSTGNVIALYAIAGFFAFLACTMVVIKSKLAAKRAEHGHEKEEEEEEESFAQRLAVIGIHSTSMSFAWGMLWATRWLALAVPAFGMPSIMGRVLMALMLSALSCAAVFGLDFVDDMHRGSEDSKAGAQAIQMMVSSLAILIGFSWEHTFDGGVIAIAESTPYPEKVKFIMGVLIASFMVPMWRRHILTKEVSLENRKQEEESNLERIKRQDKGS